MINILVAGSTGYLGSPIHEQSTVWDYRVFLECNGNEYVNESAWRP